MTETLFKDTNDQVVDPNTDYLAQLVGDGKKFKTNLDLAKGKVESDNYIQTLVREKDELRADYLRLKEEFDNRARFEDLLDQLKGATQPTTHREQPITDDVSVAPKKIDPNEFESLVSNTVQKIEQKKTHDANLQQVQAKLTERFGSNYQSALNQTVANLGLDKAFVDNIAKTSPQAFYKLIGLEGENRQETFQSPLRTSVRSDGFLPTSGPKRTWSYYQKMRQEQPKLYHDPKTVVQMHKDAQDLGDAFADGDWDRI